jgi:regulatory protein
MKEELINKDIAPINDIKRINMGKEAALKLLRNKDKTVSEITKDLKKKTFSDEEIEAVILILVEYDLLDDQRYCERFIEEGKNKKKGKNKIKYELLDKGIEKEMVLSKLEEGYTYDEEEENAIETLDKIFSGKVLDRKILEKGYGKLRYQGFKDDIIRSAIKKYKMDQEEENDI